MTKTLTVDNDRINDDRIDNVFTYDVLIFWNVDNWPLTNDRWQWTLTMTVERWQWPLTVDNGNRWRWPLTMTVDNDRWPFDNDLLRRCTSWTFDNDSSWCSFDNDRWRMTDLTMNVDWFDRFLNVDRWHVDNDQLTMNVQTIKQIWYVWHMTEKWQNVK